MKKIQLLVLYLLLADAAQAQLLSWFPTGQWVSANEKLARKLGFDSIQWKGCGYMQFEEPVKDSCHQDTYWNDTTPPKPKNWPYHQERFDKEGRLVYWNRDSMLRQPDDENYTYDKKGRLVRLYNGYIFTFQYKHNRVREIVEEDTERELLSKIIFLFHYDRSGRIISETQYDITDKRRRICTRRFTYRPDGLFDTITTTAVGYDFSLPDFSTMIFTYLKSK